MARETIKSLKAKVADLEANLERRRKYVLALEDQVGKLKDEAQQLTSASRSKALDMHNMTNKILEAEGGARKCKLVAGAGWVAALALLVVVLL